MLMNIGKITNNYPINQNFAMRFVLRARIALKSKLLIIGGYTKLKLKEWFYSAQRELSKTIARFMIALEWVN